VHDSEPSMAYNNRGYSWFRQHDLERAIADFTRAVQLNPKLLLAYHNRSMACEMKGDAARALADLNEVIRLDPKDWWAHNARASIRATWPDVKYRDGKRGVEDATLACELTRWADPTALDTLAAAYAEAGDFSKAIDTQQKALALPSPDADRATRRARVDGYRRKEPYHRGPDAIASSSTGSRRS
jgi:tetratricopeptide (TPR) repeat protein